MSNQEQTDTGFLPQAVEQANGDPGTELRDDVAAALPRLCRAFGRLIECLPGSVRRAADVQRALGLDKALGWQVFRLGSAADPIGAGLFVPRPAPLARVLAAARRCGVPEEAVVDAAETVAAFERLVERHAGDRG